MDTKRCPSCSTTKSVNDFYRHGQAYSGWCKDCAKARSKEQAVNGYYKERRKLLGAKERYSMSEIERGSCALWANAKKRSMRMGLDFDLTPEWLTSQVAIFCESNHHSWESRHPFKPSIDRIEGKGGYVQSNVRIMWMIENFARNTFTDAQVLEFCQRKIASECASGGL